jgi:hypothetical protein
MTLLAWTRLTAAPLTWAPLSDGAADQLNC